MGEFRNDREAAHLRVEALEQENRRLREALSEKGSAPAPAGPPARAPRSRQMLVVLGAVAGVCVASGAVGFLMVSRPRPALDDAPTLRFAGTFATESVGSGGTLRAVTVTEGASWVVGDGGATYFRDGRSGAWQRVPSGTTADLHGIAAGGALVAVGARGTILLFDTASRSWRAEASGTTEDLHAIVAADGGAHVVVGARGTILVRERRIGGAPGWQVVASGTVANLRAAARSAYGGDTIIAVGDGGTILAGSVRGPWTRQVSPTGADLRGVAASSGEYVAVGAGGVVVRTAGTAPWSLIDAGTRRDLHAVAAWNVPYEERGPSFFSSGTQSAFVAVGDGGQVLASRLGSREGWRALREGGPALRAMAGDEGAVLVGDGGTALAMSRR